MNTQTNLVEVVILIQHQILITNLQGDVLQLEARINNQILGLKGLRASTCKVEGKSATWRWQTRQPFWLANTVALIDSTECYALHLNLKYFNLIQ